MSDKFKDIDALLNGIIKPQRTTLKQLFDNKLLEFNIAPTTAYKIIGVQSRTMKGILSGNQKTIDVTNLTKIANFLQLPTHQIIELYLDTLEENFPTYNISPEKIEFIKQNFDLGVLRKAGLIKNLTDFEDIENKIVARLGLKSIFEYKKPNIDIAFSSGLFKPENDNTRAFWIQAAVNCFREIDNQNIYRREDLLRIFPSILWHTTDVERGLEEVIRALYKIGITVIFQPPMQKLQLRGATFSCNNKPCIVLTNYLGFYPTLWFALVHELYHVLFDWEEIESNTYHLTDDSNEQLSVRKREEEADNFSREFILSKEKLSRIRPYLNDARYVSEFAAENYVHPSFIYVFNAFDLKNENRNAWAMARKFSPDVSLSTRSFDLPWELPLEPRLRVIQTTIYN